MLRICKKIERSDLYKEDRKLFNIEDINLDKINVSKKKKYGEKGSFIYYIGYDDNDKVIPLIIKLPQMIVCYNIYDDGKKGNDFRCNDDKVLRIYIEIREKNWKQHK